MRSFSLNLEGRVKNYSLPKDRPLIPLYEAVVNSIHAIDERRNQDANFSNGLIEIRVFRSQQIPITENEVAPLEPVVGFDVIDNGIGFNEQNMQSFFESDSGYKSKLGGKGVERFSWLRAFSEVKVSSVYYENDVYLKRDFVFSLSNEPVDDTLSEVDATDCKTSIMLDTYRHEYRKSKNLPRHIETIAMRIVQHCLVYFLDKNCPKIIIVDDFEDTIVLNQLFEEKVKTAANTEIFKVEDIEFTLLNVEVEDKSFPGNRLYLCANNRLVESRDLEPLIVDLDSQLFEQNGFLYIGVLTSEYLDENVDMNRLSFNIPESGETMFDRLSLDAIVAEAQTCIEKYLAQYLVPISEEKTKRIIEYVTNNAPQFRHLLKYMPNQISKLKPRLSDEKLDDELYGIRREFDKTARLEQRELLDKLDKEEIPLSDYEAFFRKQIEKISDANSASLAEYVTHRRVIIELLSRGLRRQNDGKFNKEQYIHNLFYPTRATSDDIDYEAHNLWLIDEKLSYCYFIASDTYFDNDPKQERTDILILDNPVAVSDDKNDGTVFDTIIIFELKKPMRDDYTDRYNPITQLYSYVRKIRSREARDKYHRIINVNDSTKYYLYAICDITDKLLPFLDQNGFTQTPDNLGYFNFNKPYNAYFEVLSYDKILNDARKRNKVLFDKLGLV